MRLATNVTIKTGSEGPHHDPYSFTEYVVTRGKEEIVRLHLGFCLWVKVGHERRDYYDEGAAVLAFERCARMTLRQFDRAWQRIHCPKRCRNCHSKALVVQSGFPGEELVICQRCGNVNAAHFNERSIH